MKSVRSHCVAGSVATDVTGDKLDCHFTQTPVPLKPTNVRKIKSFLRQLQSDKHSILKYTRLQELSTYQGLFGLHYPALLDTITSFCPTPGLISLCAQVLQFPVKVVVTAHTDLKKHIGPVIPSLTVDCLLTSQSPVEILRSCLNNFSAVKEKK